MEPNKGEGNPEQEESLFEQVIRERNQEINTFEIMVLNNSEFELALATLDDSFLLRLYEYLIGEYKKLRFMLDDRDNEEDITDTFNRYERITDMIKRLEDLEFVQVYVESKTLTSKDKEQIKEIVALNVENQQYSKKGPIGKAIHRLVKRRREQKGQK